MIERDIWITAAEMIKQYGDDASVIAALRVEDMQEEGDDEGYGVWKKVQRAIEELKSTKPDGAVN